MTGSAPTARGMHATTPFARLLATNTLDPAVRERLERLYAETNPRALRHTIQAGLHALLYPRPTVLAPTASARRARSARPRSQLSRPTCGDVDNAVGPIGVTRRALST